MASVIPGGLKQGMPFGSPSKDLFRLASIDYKPLLEVTPTYVADILSRSTNALSSINFTHSIIDKPQGGQIFLISLSPNAEVPSDGYFYPDPEVTHKMPLPDGRELLCMERQGFSPSDQVTSKIRRRYRFANDHQDLQLLHYSLSERRQQQIVPPFTRQHPTPNRYTMTPMAPMQASMSPYGRPPNAISPMTIQSPGPSSMHTPPSALGRGPVAGTPSPMSNSYVQFQTRVTGGQRGPQPGMPQTPTKSAGRRTKNAKNKAAAAAAAAAATAEEADEPSGDEIDNLKFREVAMSRYKRNHEYISDIFSAYSVSSIIPPNSVYQEKNIDELKQQLATHQADIDKLKNEHSEKIEVFKRQSNILSKSMTDLSKCNTVEELSKLQERTEKELDILIKPLNPVALIQIRDGPESDVEVESHNDLMQEDAISEELLMERNSEHEGLVELDQGLSTYEIGKDLVNTNELHDTSGIEGIEELEGLKNIQGIQGIEGIEGIEGIGRIDTGLNENNLQGYFSSANMPGLTNDPNLQLGGLTGDPNIEDHSNYTGLAISTNYGGDSSQMFNEYIHTPDEVMEDEVPLP
ncbi:uncharacterized protein OCT59_005365 [Rhizophagus irregularis]|uniref:Swi/snf and rsc complex subunit ssr4 n=2 Tax=Rhizophagus irregularis TaxID=588596 RepID=A0A015II34_RHIIW|nr:hypothetical protein RirG_212720 [Rhizophagus irregularis DAOM 197198w]UZO13884.1 hypothetical protein OCT59_005365 [Rhizophagus irregularis]GBC20954.1 hypothetical protein RIR_jg24055.t1 [Rhizophagus irregularis DAOM 181602=DAOM 197198]